MDLTSFKEKLGDDAYESLTSYVNDLKAITEKAKKESIDGRKTLKAEVETLRKVKSTLFEKLGLDDDADLDTLVIPTKGAELEASKKYEAQIKKLTQELATTKEAFTGLESKHRAAKLDATLAKAIASHNFLDAELVTEFAKGRVKFEGDELFYTDGDKLLSVDEGVKLIATTKPHLLKSQGGTGSGFNNTAHSGTVKAFKDMTLTEKTELFKTNPAAYQAMKGESL